MITAEEIRKLYPNPRTVRNDTAGTYCVGGAFYKYLASIPCYQDAMYNKGVYITKSDTWFPSASTLQRVLRIYGKNVSEVSCRQLAKKNDQGMFEEAWDILDELLSR